MIDPRGADVLAGTDVIDADHPAVSAAATAHTRELATVHERVSALFRFVRDDIEYDMAPDLVDRSSWRASATLERGWGFCQQKAVLLVALARSAGIPAVLAFQSVVDHRMPDRFEVFLPGKRMRPHGLVAVWVDDRWQYLDPSLHRSMCERRRLRVVEWTPGSDALLPTTDLDGAPHCTIEDDLGAAADLPAEIVDATMSIDVLRDAAFRAAARRHPAR